MPNVLEGDVVMRETKRVGAAVGAVLLTGALLSCNTIPKRELPAGGVVQATCVNQCIDDVDPQPVDCAAAEVGVEFYPIAVWDFDSIASNLYGYSDGSPQFFRSVLGRDENGEVEYDEQGIRLMGFEPGVRRDVKRCVGEEEGSNGVFHFQGGPFRAWGGAVGRHLKCLNSAGGDIYSPDQFTVTYPAGDTPDSLNKGCGSTPGFACADPNDALAYSACPERDQVPVEQMAQQEFFMRGMTLDLRRWDGISFWARRTNDSQPGIRVALGDKYTDDDLSYLQYHLNPDDQRFCERNQECGCPGGRECVNGTCYDPRVDPPLDPADVMMRESFVDGTMIPVLNEDNDPGYAPCGQWICERGFRAFRGAGGSSPREDVAFFGSTCNDFTFRGGITDKYCYDPAGNSPPHENSHVCGDHWLKPVHLSTEWQFFKVPFTDLLQQGWAKESYELDLTSAAVVRFIWGRGWVDMMLDDVRFYRNTHSKD
jgi:hypothetical protein